MQKRKFKGRSKLNRLIITKRIINKIINSQISLWEITSHFFRYLIETNPSFTNTEFIGIFSKKYYQLTLRYYGVKELKMIRSDMPNKIKEITNSDQ